MLIKSIASCAEITAGDDTLLREVLAPGKDPVELRYSLARARLLPGRRSTPHQLRSSEVYVVLSGGGAIAIDGERRRVAAGDVVYVPPGAVQHVENDGGDDLVFLCIVDPPWRAEDEILASESP